MTRSLQANGTLSLRLPAASAVAVVIFYALLLRLLIIWRTGFDGLYGQDAFAYLDYAAAFKDALARAQWPPSFFWPIGYPALAAGLSLLLPLNVAAQTISIAAGVLTAALVFLIVRELLGDQPRGVIAALGAGIAVAGSGQLLISSLCTMSDAASLFWATLSGFAVLRYRRTHTLRWVALAAFALGWAMTTRWVYGLLIPVWAIALTVQLRDWRRLFQAGVVAGLFSLFALLPQGLLIVNQTGADPAAFTGDVQVYSWNPLDAFRSDIVNADGSFRYAWTIGGFYSFPFIQPDYMPIWFTPLVLLGVWALRGRRMELFVFLGWLGVTWAFLIGVSWENWRFPLAFFPPLAVLGGVGLHRLLERAPSRSVRLIGVWLTIGLLVACAWSLYDVSTFIGRQLDERSIVSWVEERVPADASILTFGETATLQHFTSHRVVEMASETPQSVETLAHENKDVYLLLDVENVESQWQGLAPQINFQALQNDFVLRPIAVRGAYVLYAVMSP